MSAGSRREEPEVEDELRGGEATGRGGDGPPAQDREVAVRREPDDRPSLRTRDRRAHGHLLRERQRPEVRTSREDREKLLVDRLEVQ